MKEIHVWHISITCNNHIDIDIAQLSFGPRARDGEEIQRAPRRTSLTLRRLKHVQLEAKAVMDAATKSAKDAQWQWWNSQISEID